MKILILGSIDTPETQFLKEEIEKRNHEFFSLDLQDFSMRCSVEEIKVLSKIDTDSIDAVIVRGIYHSYQFDGENFNSATQAQVLLKHLHNNHKIIIDERVISQNNIMSKASTALDIVSNGLPYPQTTQYGSLEKVKNDLDKINFPIIVKNPAGRKGEKVYKFDDKDSLEKYLSEKANGAEGYMPFIFQEYLPNDGDIRVIVVGYKVIGAMKRSKAPGDFRANISQGGEGSVYDLNDEIIKLAEGAARATQTEVAGVDLIYSNGKYYIIEVNRAPQFRGFVQYTGINPAKYIIDYIEEKAARTRA